MSTPRYGLIQCGNMNHGRSNVAINFCPQCGLKFDSRTNSNCNQQKHAESRRSQHKFCFTCGLNLKSVK